jgi:hypothetical protein
MGDEGNIVFGRGRLSSRRAAALAAQVDGLSEEVRALASATLQHERGLTELRRAVAELQGELGAAGGQTAGGPTPYAPAPHAPIPHAPAPPAPQEFDPVRTIEELAETLSSAGAWSSASGPAPAPPPAQASPVRPTPTPTEEPATTPAAATAAADAASAREAAAELDALLAAVEDVARALQAKAA